MDFRQQTLLIAGGVVGLTLALRLGRRGARVRLCDPARSGENASAVAAGMLAPEMETVLDVLPTTTHAMLRAARDGWPGLAAEAGSILDQRAAMAAGSAGYLDGIERRLAELQVEFRRLNAEFVQAIAPGVEAGLSIPGDWRLDPRQTLVKLRATARAVGVEFEAGALRAFSEGEAVLDNGSRCAADAVILATGLSSGLREMAPELDLLTPIKGQILHLPEAPQPQVVVRGEGVYVAPAASGVVIGATMEAGRLDLEPDSALAGELRDRAAGLIPSLRHGPAEIRVGVRAATPDGLPLVGASSAPGVWLAVGMRRNGWLLAPLVADVLIARMTGELSPWAAALDPRRFDP